MSILNKLDCFRGTHTIREKDLTLGNYLFLETNGFQKTVKCRYCNKPFKIYLVWKKSREFE